MKSCLLLPLLLVSCRAKTATVEPLRTAARVSYLQPKTSPTTPAASAPPTQSPAARRASPPPPRIQIGARRLRIVARGLSPGAGYRLQPEERQLVLGWLRTNACGDGEIRLAHPLPPGRYLVFGPKRTRVVRAPGDRGQWRRAVASNYRERLDRLRIAEQELVREWDMAMTRTRYVLGDDQAFYEPAWRRFCKRWHAGVTTLQQQIVDARRTFQDLTFPDLHRTLVSASTELSCLGRVRSRQLYLARRRKPHPDDARQPGDPVVQAQRLARRVSSQISRAANLLPRK